MKNEYHVGELANFFGVSRDTLRLYDKMGILSPKKNERNNYRSYNRADLICLDYVMRLRKIDLPLSDIRTMVTDSTIERAEAMMQLQDKILEDKINEMKKLQITVRDYQKGFSNVIRNLDSISIRQSPVLICKNVEDSLIDAMSAFSRLETSHVPIFTFTCDKELFLSQEYLEWNMSEEKRKEVYGYAITMIDDENLAQRESALLEGFHVIPPRKCVYSAVKCYTNVNYDGFFKVRAFLLDEGLELSDQVLLRAVSMRNSVERSVDYYEIWAPIK